MRQIVLDTETTGLSPQEGHRLVELGCIEVMNHVPTGNVFHRYINPERDMPEGAFKVHGLSSEFLSDKPKFAEIADEFLAFIAEDELVIHNAAFDMAFLNYELKLVSRPPIAARRAIDTLTIARQRFPGAQNSLDALCKRFDIDNSGRVKHGALLDAELLAEVYLELMGGRQPTLVLDASAAALSRGAAVAAERRERPVPLAPRITDAERTAHDAFIDTLGAEPLWRHLPS